MLTNDMLLLKLVFLLGMYLRKATHTRLTLLPQKTGMINKFRNKFRHEVRQESTDNAKMHFL